MNFIFFPFLISFPFVSSFCIFFLLLFVPRKRKGLYTNRKDKGKRLFFCSLEQKKRHCLFFCSLEDETVTDEIASVLFVFSRRPPPPLKKKMNKTPIEGER